MKSGAAIAVWICAAISGAPGLAHAQKPSPAPVPSTPPSAPAAGPVQLDRVVAKIGTNVILQSDVQEEMEFSALEPLLVLPGQNTPENALRRLIDRTLILEQMKQQQQPVTTAAAEVQNSVAELKKQIPACMRYHCETQQGWDAFLGANHLTRGDAEQRWSQRMAILRFIDIRFRSGITISSDQVAAYYQGTLVPALAKAHEPAPPLSQVSGRIQELLLQQHVSGLFQDWLASLRDQGNVEIVDPAYAGLTKAIRSSGDDTDTGGPAGPEGPNP